MTEEKSTRTYTNLTRIAVNGYKLWCTNIECLIMTISRSYCIFFSFHFSSLWATERITIVEACVFVSTVHTIIVSWGVFFSYCLVLAALVTHIYIWWHILRLILKKWTDMRWKQLSKLVHTIHKAKNTREKMNGSGWKSISVRKWQYGADELHQPYKNKTWQ